MPADKEIRAKCAHFWIIGPQEGPLSKGVCKYCGTEQEFINSLDFDAVSINREKATRGRLRGHAIIKKKMLERLEAQDALYGD